MFYGIIIRMYALDTKQHHLPHIHVEYAGIEAVFQIPDGELLEGVLPAKQNKLVQAWLCSTPTRLWRTGHWQHQEQPLTKLTP